MTVLFETFILLTLASAICLSLSALYIASMPTERETLAKDTADDRHPTE